MKETVYSKHFEKIVRSEITRDDGLSLLEFKRGLTPSFARVWFDISLGYAALAVTILALAAAQTAFSPFLVVPCVLLGAASVGFWVAYFGLFFHEAAHYNIAPNRAWNDRLANFFLGSFMGQDIKAYRIVHFDHHRHHGTTMDTEHSYFDPLNARFIVEALTGVKAARVLLSRDKHTSRADTRTLGSMMLVGAALNGTIALIALALGYWSVCFAWCGGILFFLPFFIALRQVLEHRAPDASPAVDYSKTDHGAFNRMFGDGPLASTLGGAGFNRHLLHHWDPQVPYTRLRELEDFVRRTKLKEPLEALSSTYVGTFVALYKAGSR